jgi:hypothetical protein
LTDDRVLFVKRCRGANLSEVQVELVAALLLSHFCMLPNEDTEDCEALFRKLGLEGSKVIEIHRNLSGKGPLYDLGFLIPPDPDDAPEDRRVQLDPIFADEMLHNHDSAVSGWAVTTEDELYQMLSSLKPGISST